MNGCGVIIRAEPGLFVMLTALRMGGIAALALFLSACVSTVLEVDGKATQPIPTALVAEMSRKSMTPSAPILIRIFKQESELEIWKRDRSGRFALLKTYPMCRWSGKLGPKRRTVIARRLKASTMCRRVC